MQVLKKLKRRLYSLSGIPQAPIPEVVRMVAEPWYVDAVERLEESPGLLRVSGWALPDPDFKELAAQRFLINGKKPVEVEYPLLRMDVRDVFRHRIDAEFSGFRMVIPEEYVDGVMQLRCINTHTELPAAGREVWFLPDFSKHQNLPDPDRRHRVIGNRDPEGFLRLGATDAFRIKMAYERVTGGKWEDLGAVLDWGVGCGRVARHIAPALGSRFFGCDIDSDNVDWCKSNLPGNFSASRLEPPLPYEDNSFDVIYGISVFTHLRAVWEARWLEELHRVLRPGGVILMTVHGQTAIDFAALTPNDFMALQARVRDEGLVVTSSNNQLDGFVDHPEEYVNVFHSLEHIRNTWGRWFKIQAHLPGYIFTHDLVVAQKL